MVTPLLRVRLECGGVERLPARPTGLLPNQTTIIFARLCSLPPAGWHRASHSEPADSPAECPPIPVFGLVKPRSVCQSAWRSSASRLLVSEPTARLTAYCARHAAFS